MHSLQQLQSSAGVSSLLAQMTLSSMAWKPPSSVSVDVNDAPPVSAATRANSASLALCVLASDPIDAVWAWKLLSSSPVEPPRPGCLWGRTKPRARDEEARGHLNELK